MDIIVVMGAGILIGAKFFPNKWKKINEKFQILCTVLLIFCMGVTLGGRENFIGEFISLGGLSFLYFLVPTILSIILVYFLSRRFIDKKSKEVDL